jgi:cell division topological specificity factor
MSLIDNLLDYLRGSEKKTAAVAKERLQILIAHERANRNASSPDYLPALQEELLAVIAKYIHVERDMIKVQLEKHGEYDVLELNIMLPEDKRVGT